MQCLVNDEIFGHLAYSYEVHKSYKHPRKISPQFAIYPSMIQTYMFETKKSMKDVCFHA